jgi:cell pole-organizing protein PopZ
VTLPAASAAEPALTAPPAEPALQQDEIEAMLTDLNAPAPAAAANDDPPTPGVFDLTEAMATSPPEPATGFQRMGAEPDVLFENKPLQDQDMASFAHNAPNRPDDKDVLLSATTSAAVDSAFSSLAHTVLVQNGRTLEELVREMLRPMLKSWLDDNLPNLVERLVRAEIERVSRGRN